MGIILNSHKKALFKKALQNPKIRRKAYLVCRQALRKLAAGETISADAKILLIQLRELEKAEQAIARKERIRERNKKNSNSAYRQTAEYKKRHSEAMKKAWERRRMKENRGLCALPRRDK